MTTQIKAIETRYNGYRFRSRLEARWAVFFDALDIPYEYEPQGFEWPAGDRITGGRYLPDFWLPTINGGCWFEVKGEFIKDQTMLDEFVNLHQNHLFLAWGPMLPNRLQVERGGWPCRCGIEWLAPHAEWPDICNGDSDYRFCSCWKCGRIGLQFEGRTSRICNHPDEDFAGRWFHEERQIEHAYATAASARFEHGENGR